MLRETLVFRLWTLLAASSLLLASDRMAGAADPAHPLYVWTGDSWRDSDPTNDNYRWDNPANWECDGVAGVPPTNAVVSIASYVEAAGTNHVFKLHLEGYANVTVDHLKVEQLELIAGALHGGSIIVQDHAMWAGGTIGAECHILEGAIFDISDTPEGYYGMRSLENGALINSGTINWNASQPLRGNGTLSARIQNLRGASFNASGATELFAGNGTLDIEDGAVLRKEGAATTKLTGWTINLRGESRAEEGELYYWATLNVLDGSSFTGSGIHHSVGVYALFGTNLARSAVVLDGPYFVGSTSNATISTADSGYYEWKSGSFTGILNIATGTVLHVKSSGVRPVLGLMNNHGLTTFSGGAQWGPGIFFPQDFRFNNLSGGVLAFEQSGPICSGSGLSCTLFNSAGGLIRKDGDTNSVEINPSLFENEGVIEARSGGIEFAEPTYLRDGTVLRGPGDFSGRRLFLSGMISADTRVTIDGQSPSVKINCSNATVTTYGDGLIEWRAGSILGTLTVTRGTHIRSAGSSWRSFDNCVINNHGIWEFEGPKETEAGPFERDVVFNNLPGGSLNIRSNAFMVVFPWYSYAAHLTNSGVINISGSCSIACYVHLRPEGILHMEAAGNRVGEYSQLSIGRIYTSQGGLDELAGAFEVDLQNGYLPTNGTSFEFLLLRSPKGKFDSLNVPELPHLNWRDIYVPSGYAWVASPIAFRLIVEHSRVVNPRRLPGVFSFQFIDSAAELCVVEASEDLRTWIPVATNSPFSGTLLFEDAEANAHPQRFYRVTLQP